MSHSLSPRLLNPAREGGHAGSDHREGLAVGATAAFAQTRRNAAVRSASIWRIYLAGSRALRFPRMCHKRPSPARLTEKRPPGRLSDKGQCPTSEEVCKTKGAWSPPFD
jgi:hypothetical protein